MRRARDGAAAAADAATAAVAPLLQLKRAAESAHRLSRFVRSVELFERALAAAERAQPRDSLVVAALLEELCIAHTDVAVHTESASAGAAAVDATDRNRLHLLHLLHARWHAGTLFAPTADETAYFVDDEYPRLPAQMCGAYFYIATANAVVRQDLQELALAPRACAEAKARGVCGALRAALEMDARGMLQRNPRTGQAWSALAAEAPAAHAAMLVTYHRTEVHRLITDALSHEAGLLPPMRAACGLTAAEETALRRLAARQEAAYELSAEQQRVVNESVNLQRQQAAAADTARHGLRRCALPTCDAQEAHPKLFKLCSRCRSAAYCCVEHQTEDWKRHKREDGCKPAA
jgi:hypothetical protein